LFAIWCKQSSHNMLNSWKFGRIIPEVKLSTDLSGLIPKDPKKQFHSKSKTTKVQNSSW
jgi:hypothetical protein